MYSRAKLKTQLEHETHVKQVKLNQILEELSKFRTIIDGLIQLVGKSRNEQALLEQRFLRLEESIDNIKDITNNAKSPKYLTTAQVAIQTGYSECSIRNFHKEGKIASTGKSGKYYKFTCEEVERFQARFDLNSPRRTAKSNARLTMKGEVRKAA
jgi:hypothetical protein